MKFYGNRCLKIRKFSKTLRPFIFSNYELFFANLNNSELFWPIDWALSYAIGFA